DVAAVDSRGTWQEVLDVMRRTEHVRVPVFDDTLDNIIGILHARDVAPGAVGEDAPERWQDLVRPSEFVPESKTLAQQLRDFIRAGSYMAIVVDEFGGTAGLVTRGDIQEQIIGDIRDAVGDGEEPVVEQEGGDRFWVDGSVSLDQLSSLLGTPLERD